MDKSWITKAKWSCDYVNGVNNFIEFASRSQNLSGKILCPCKSIINRYFYSLKDVQDQLISKGFFPGYVVWNRHGENTNEENDHGEKFSNLMQDAGAELYLRCKTFSKLSFILKLFCLKCLYSRMVRSFDMLLELLVDAFLKGVLLPKSMYEVKKIIKAYDLGYTKIDACLNDCMLFWKDSSD
ncbi:hypothetical protein MA16_Dca026744 [Dendrobium catenatum]|uniref:Transposase-associated domain-containing protein n=1 Tax=Dendrobium catenatum TaxID=906689 RepID=A0A2I0W2P1_9ASPA|nr:hypothetical protein MA16_Dca026744 [Dendrobium catenatum]